MANRLAWTAALCLVFAVAGGVRAESTAAQQDEDETNTPAVVDGAHAKKRLEAGKAEQPAPIPPAPERKPADEPKPKVPPATPERTPDGPNPPMPTSTPEPAPDKSKPTPPRPTPEPMKDPAPVAPKPAPKPVAPEKATPGNADPDSATADASKPNNSEFPTPAELIKRMREKSAKKASMTRVAYFDLNQPVVEKPADFSLFGGESGITLRQLVNRIHMARDDKSIRAVLITLGSPQLNLAQAQEIRDALGELRKAGKKTFVYADNYDTIGYTVASGATDVCLLAGGEIMIPGIGMEAQFYKGTLEKVGVKADYVQIGEYKGAEEPYTRTEPSAELKGELNKLVDSLYEQIVDGIAQSRNLPKDAVKQMIDDTIVPAVAAKDRGFIDHLLDIDELRDLMKKELGNDVDLVYDFGRPQQEPIDVSNPFALLASITKRPEPSNKPAIALIYAEGTIVDGEGEGGLFSDGGVGSAPMRRALRTAAKDDNIKAVVIRIDSPGGSALASEVMWQAARHVASKKPVIISIGSMAASGGYYLASAGDHIFADPTAIVGSIGVVGGKFVMKDLYDKIGLTSTSFQRGRNADLFSESKPFDDRQRRLVTNWMRNTYDQFTSRVMHTRKGKIKDIDQVARGRIFLAKQARELGMVDEIGGIEAAIGYAAGKAKMTKGQYDVRVLPAPRTLADMFAGGGAEGAGQAALPFKAEVKISEDSILRALSPTMRKTLGQQIQFMQLLQDRPVVLVAPYVITVK
jgi:protease-4